MLHCSGDIFAKALYVSEFSSIFAFNMQAVLDFPFVDNFCVNLISVLGLGACALVGLLTACLTNVVGNTCM
jgi:hypothetical protein